MAEVALLGGLVATALVLLLVARHEVLKREVVGVPARLGDDAVPEEGLGDVVGVGVAPVAPRTARLSRS